MADSHVPLKITFTDWKAFMNDLNQTLDMFHILAPEQQEVITIVERTNDIVVVG